MTEIKVLKQFYRWNRSVRQNYLKAMMGLSTEELTRDRGASYPSLLDIFDHVLDAYDFWFVQVLGASAESGRQEDATARTIEAVATHEKTTGDAVMAYTEKLTETDLDREIKFSGESPPSKMGDICWHMVEEELQHRGELNALLWQLNVDPPLGSYEQWQDARGTSHE